ARSRAAIARRVLSSRRRNSASLNGSVPTRRPVPPSIRPREVSTVPSFWQRAVAQPEYPWVGAPGSPLRVVRCRHSGHPDPPRCRPCLRQMPTVTRSRWGDPCAVAGRGVSMTGAREYDPHVVVELLGRKTHILDLSREIGPGIPIYPGHAKVAFWWHLTHDEVKHYRIHPESRFGGYGVKGMALCDHVSTHIDAVYHFNRNRPDLTVERIGLETLITPGAWIDVSSVPPRTHITLPLVQRALSGAGVTLRSGMTLLCYTGASKHWDDPVRFNSEYPGLDEAAARWLSGRMIDKEQGGRMAESFKRGWQVNIAVVDSGANLVAFVRMDGAPLASIAIAEHKARTAAKFRRPTKVFEDAVQKSGFTY